MDITKLNKKYHYEEIMEQMKKQIVQGRLKPGDKLPSTKELSERYGVGRSTVREALSGLKAMGLIDIRQGEGCTVRKVDADEVDLSAIRPLLLSKEAIFELLEARQSIEVSNAGLAAKKRKKEDLLRFENILANMEEYLGNEEEGEKADIAFHRALATATHNAVMYQVLEAVSSQMEKAIRETRRIYMFSDRSESEQLLEQHRAIFEAVRERNEEKARRAMIDHLQHVERVIRRVLNKADKK